MTWQTDNDQNAIRQGIQEFLASHGIEVHPPGAAVLAIERPWLVENPGVLENDVIQLRVNVQDGVIEVWEYRFQEKTPKQAAGFRFRPKTRIELANPKLLELILEIYDGMVGPRNHGR